MEPFIIMAVVIIVVVVIFMFFKSRSKNNVVEVSSCGLRTVTLIEHQWLRLLKNQPQIMIYSKRM